MQFLAMLNESGVASELGSLNVLEILKLGGSGLVFLLALLGYNLLRTAARNKASTAALGTIRFYMWIALGLAGLVTAGSLVEKYIGAQGRLAEVRECRNSLARLDTQSRMPGVTADNLRNGIVAHRSKCETLLEKNDVQY